MRYQGWCCRLDPATNAQSANRLGWIAISIEISATSSQSWCILNSLVFLSITLYTKILGRVMLRNTEHQRPARRAFNCSSMMATKSCLQEAAVRFNCPLYAFDGPLLLLTPSLFCQQRSVMAQPWFCVSSVRSSPLRPRAACF